MDKINRAAERGLQWIDQQLHDDGSFGPAIDDLACYYKSPYLFSLMGRRKSAHRVLDHIKERFMLSNGDFATSESFKSINPLFTEFWAYTNGWIAIAAQRMGRFDVAQPAYDYLKHFFNPKLGGFTTQRPYKDEQEMVDVVSTAHLGLLSLYFNDVETAKAAGGFLAAVLDKQPDMANKFFLRVDGRGQLITTYSHETALLHQVGAREHNQAYFMVGYPAAFLAILFQATGEKRFLETAKRYLDFAMRTKGNIISFHYSHKVMWAAALLAGITGNASYAQFAQSIANHLVGLQAQEGRWLASEPFHIGMDQTAEIAIWLAITSDELAMQPAVAAHA